jgi:hypothetical protein
MTTSLVHSTAGLLWWTPEATPGTTDDPDFPSQAQVTVMIADGDTDVEIQTGTTAQSAKRDHLVKLFTHAAALQFVKDTKGAGAEAIQTPSGSISLVNPDFFRDYHLACKNYNETQVTSTGRNPYYFLGVS